MYFIATIYCIYKLVNAEVLRLFYYVYLNMQCFLRSLRGTGRHRAATGSDRQWPTQTGTGPALTGTSLGPVHVEYLTVCVGRCQVKHRRRL